MKSFVSTVGGSEATKPQQRWSHRDFWQLLTSFYHLL